MVASWTFDSIINGFRSFDSENLGSVGQRAAKLLAIKLWEWFDPGHSQIQANGAFRIFGLKGKSVQVQSLMASNYAALWPTDLKFLAVKDLNPFLMVFFFIFSISEEHNHFWRSKGVNPRTYKIFRGQPGTYKNICQLALTLDMEIFQESRGVMQGLNFSDIIIYNCMFMSWCALSLSFYFY